MTKVKICGLKSEDDISYANELKPDYIGFVFLQGRKRYVSPSHAAHLRELLDPFIPAVGVFVNEPLEHVISLAESGTIQMIQLHGQEDEAYLRKLRERCSQPVIKAFIIRTKEDMESAIKLGNYFLEHARFAFDFMDDNTTKKQALNFLEKLKATKTNETSFREASRMCKYMNKKENATAVISLLVDYGYLREKQGTSRAHNKGLVYEVNPAIYDKKRPP